MRESLASLLGCRQTLFAELVALAPFALQFWSWKVEALNPYVSSIRSVTLCVGRGGWTLNTRCIWGQDSKNVYSIERPRCGPSTRRLGGRKELEGMRSSGTGTTSMGKKVVMAHVTLQRAPFGRARFPGADQAPLH